VNLAVVKEEHAIASQPVAAEVAFENVHYGPLVILNMLDHECRSSVLLKTKLLL